VRLTTSSKTANPPAGAGEHDDVDAGRADLVAQHNALTGRRGALAEEYNRLVADANGLIDALNWARW